jgi:hypothetical protein
LTFLCVGKNLFIEQLNKTRNKNKNKRESLWVTCLASLLFAVVLQPIYTIIVAVLLSLSLSVSNSIHHSQQHERPSYCKFISLISSLHIKIQFWLLGFTSLSQIHLSHFQNFFFVLINSHFQIWFILLGWYSMIIFFFFCVNQCYVK